MRHLFSELSHMLGNLNLLPQQMTSSYLPSPCSRLSVAEPVAMTLAEFRYLSLMMTCMRNRNRSQWVLCQWSLPQLSSLETLTAQISLLRTIMVWTHTLLYIIFKHRDLFLFLPDAEVRFVTDEYRIGEESGSVSVCVESGVSGGFETALTVSLAAQDGTQQVR